MIKTTLLTTGFGILLFQTALSQVTVFDTSGGMPFAGMQVNVGDEVADDVSLSTNGATITDLELFLITFSNAGPITADISAALYTDDAGAPDTLLWSETKTGLSFATSQSSVSFDGIDIDVGRDFFWSIKIENLVADPADVWGPRLGNPAGVTPPGATTDPDFLYISTGGGPFSHASLGTVDSTLGVRITGVAIPEPSVASTLLIGAVILGFGHRRCPQ